MQLLSGWTLRCWQTLALVQQDSPCIWIFVVTSVIQQFDSWLQQWRSIFKEKHKRICIRIKFYLTIKQYFKWIKDTLLEVAISFCSSFEDVIRGTLQSGSYVSLFWWEKWPILILQQFYLQEYKIKADGYHLVEQSCILARSCSIWWLAYNIFYSNNKNTCYQKTVVINILTFY